MIAEVSFPPSVILVVMVISPIQYSPPKSSIHHGYLSARTVLIGDLKTNYINVSLLKGYVALDLGELVYSKCLKPFVMKDHGLHDDHVLKVEYNDDAQIAWFSFYF